MKIAKKYAPLAALAVIPLLIVYTAHRPVTAAPGDAEPLPIKTTPPVTPSAALTAWSNAAAAVARAVRPSVVYIQADAKTGETASTQNIPDPFREFMRRFGVPGDSNFQFFYRGPGTPGQPMIRRAAGSGFIISPDGYIVTNSHVVRGADHVEVRLLDGHSYTARVVGRDPGTDVAVIKIDGHDLPAVSFGDSDSSQVGDWVLAIGNPMGEALNFTVTAGIVSAKGRPLPDLPMETKYGIQDFIQTDAAINPGNSGGPLVDASGRVIGINSAIASETGSYEGYGFAIPINLAHHVIEELIATGTVSRAIIGITIRPVDPEDAAYVGLDSVSGVVVQGFSGDNSPALHSGLEPGDVIVALDGRPVRYVAQFQEAITFRKPGESVALTVMRKSGARKTIHVTLGTMPSGETASAQPAAGNGSATQPYGRKLGLTVEPSTGGPADRQGLVVTALDPEGPAAGKLAPQGSAQGPDVITHLDGKRVRSVSDLNDALSGATSGDVVSIETYNRSLDATRVVRLRVR
jgi:serine protease Do